MLIAGVAMVGLGVLGFLVRNRYMWWAWRHRVRWMSPKSDDDRIPRRFWFSWYACVTFLLVVGTYEILTSVT